MLRRARKRSKFLKKRCSTKSGKGLGKDFIPREKAYLRASKVKA
jgi:hypothetical protein